MTFDVGAAGRPARRVDRLHGQARRARPAAARPRPHGLARRPPRRWPATWSRSAASRCKIEAENTSTADLAGDRPGRRRGRRPARHRGRPRDRRRRARAAEKTSSGSTGRPDPAARYTVESIDVTRTRSRPYPPFITSTLQQAASSRLGHVDRPHDADRPAALRGHRPARRGPRGPDHLHADRLDEPLPRGDRDGPPLPRAAARRGLRAREAPLLLELQRERPGGPRGDPADRRLPRARPHRRRALQRRAAQALPADLAVLRGLPGDRRRVGFDERPPAAERPRHRRRLQGQRPRAAVRRLLSRSAARPKDDGDQVLPDFEKGAQLAPFDIEPRQKFQAPPPRYTEATLVKKMEEEGIGRPSTYASIINVIENRGYVDQQDRRFHATAIGEAVTGLPEARLPRPVHRDRLHPRDRAGTRPGGAGHEEVDRHAPRVPRRARAEARRRRCRSSTRRRRRIRLPTPARECGRRLEYRLGGKGRVSLLQRLQREDRRRAGRAGREEHAKGKKRRRRPSRRSVPACTFAMPVDRQRRPLLPEQIDLLSPAGVPMVKRTGRFGDFLVEDKPRPPKPKGKKAARRPPRRAAAVHPQPRQEGEHQVSLAAAAGHRHRLPEVRRPDESPRRQAGPVARLPAFPEVPRPRGLHEARREDQPEGARRGTSTAAHAAGQTKLALTRRDGVDAGAEGTPLGRTLTWKAASPNCQFQ